MQQTEGIIDGETATELAKHLLKLGNVSSNVYVNGIVQAYTCGYYGYGREAMIGKNTLSATLSEEQRNVAYGLAEQYRAAKTDADQKAAASEKKTASKKAGKVHFNGDRNSLTERQSASLKAIGKIADVLGIQVYVFESKLGKNGRRIGANGWYDPKDGSIHIDLHAGANGEGTMIFTMAHELTHFIRQWSPAKFKILADFLMQEYGKKGVSVDALVREQQAKAKRTGRTISYDTAYEEVVADSMEAMLSDGKVMEKLAKLKAQDAALWQKIKDYISKLAEKIRMAYKGLAPDSVEGRYVAEMKDAVERFQELFTEGLADAGENFQSFKENVREETTVRIPDSPFSEDIKKSERNYPIDNDVALFVNDALNKDKAGTNTIGTITTGENSAINRMANARNGGDRYRGKFTGGEHIVTNDAIKHMAHEHGNTLREALRAQLPLTEEDIARAFSAIKNGRSRISGQPTRTSQGNASLLQIVEVNGYTLYAEEILKPAQKGGTQSLIGHTMYKAPTLSTADGRATSALPLPKRQSEVLYKKKHTTAETDLSSISFVADKSGVAAKLYFQEVNGTPVKDNLHGGLILLSSYKDTISGMGADQTNIQEGYARISNPYIITPDHRVFSNSEVDVAKEIKKLKNAGYDGFIFDYKTGDNYAIMVFNKAQVVKDISDYEVRHSDRDTDSVSNRSLLANAFEGAAQTDMEKQKIREYREKIDLMNGQE